MTESFLNKLEDKINKVGSSLCVGIDPHFSAIPPSFQRIIEDKGEYYFLDWFGNSVLESSIDVGVAAIKFQSAFFEAFGVEGINVLKNLLKKCNTCGMISILDAKRGDISSTMSAYGKAAFTSLDADVLTITPYMGIDVLRPLEPFLKNGKGVYVVWLSSNESGRDLQDLKTKNNKSVAHELFDIIEAKTSELQIENSIGYVLGATKVQRMPEDLFYKALKKPLLLPGVGAQGASIDQPRISEVLDFGIHLVPVSRGISGFGQNYLDPRLKQGLDTTSNFYKDFLKSQIEAFKKNLTPRKV